MYIKIDTIKDFINSYIHILSQLKRQWLPAVGLSGYLNSWYNYMNLEDQCVAPVSVRDIHTQKISEVLGKDFWGQDRSQSFEEFNNKIGRIFDYIKEKDKFYYRWLSKVLYLGKFKDKIVKTLFEEFSIISDNNSYYIPYSSYDYPGMLKNIQDPPTAISVRGNLDIFVKPMIAIIGSRHASREALKEAYCLSRLLAARGVVVVSGGAIGCDMASHLGASYGLGVGVGVDAGAGVGIGIDNNKQSKVCNTVVVFAGGLGHMYPKCHIKYFNEIEKQGGAFVSERLWNDRSRSKDFPVRNRIISGLCGGVVMVQADTRSGSSVTGQLSINQGRELYVLLRKSEAYCGNIKFFKEGAVGYYGYEDFINKKFYRYVSC